MSKDIKPSNEGVGKGGQLESFDPKRAQYERTASKAAMEVAENQEQVRAAMEKHIHSTANLIVWYGANFKAGQPAKNSTRSGRIKERPFSPTQAQNLRKKLAVKDESGWRIDDAKVDDFRDSLFRKYAGRFAGVKDAEHGGAVSLSTGFYEWYTPPEYIAAVRDAMGSIDLDPASNEKANETVQAGTFYTKDDNGLELPWRGNVFCNPPYSAPLVRAFADKLADEVHNGDATAGIFLVHNATDATWWQNLSRASAAICFPDKRINFIKGTTMQQEAGSSIRGQSVFYLGDDVDAFIREFQRFGVIVKVIA